MKRSSPIRTLATFVLACVTTLTSHGVSIWDLRGTGDWNVSSNWRGGIPGEADSATIMNSGTAQITTDLSTKLSSVTVGFQGEPGHLEINGAGRLDLFNTAYIGSWQDGSLSINSGGQLTSAYGDIGMGRLGFFYTSNGVVTVSGAGSRWDLSTISFSGTTLRLGVYSNGNGTLNINDQGVVTTTDKIPITVGANGTGRIQVSGAGSLLDAGAAINVGVGTLNATDAGVIKADSLTMGVIAPGTTSISEASGIDPWLVRLDGASDGNISGTGSRLEVATDLVVSRNSTGTLTIGSGGLAQVNGNIVIAGEANSVGTLNLETGGVLQVGGVNAVSNGLGNGSLNLAGGTLQVFGADLSSDGDALLAANTTSAFDTNGFDASWAGNLSGDGALTKAGSGTLVLTGTNTYTGATRIDAGTLQLGDGGSTGSLAPGGPIINNASLSFDRSNTVIQGTDFAEVISGSGAVNQIGTGTLVFTGDNTYTGLTTISDGTLQIGNGGETGSVASTAIINDSSLVFDRSNAVTYDGMISGSGSLTQAGTGTLTLSANHSYTGGTTIETGGTLQLGNGNASGSVSGNISNDGTLIINRSDDYTYDGLISGSGGLVIDGFIVRLLNPQSYTGLTSIKSGGYLVLSTTQDQGLSASTMVDIESGGFLDISNRALTVAGLTGAGEVYSFNAGAGHLTVNTAAGQDQVFSGILGSTFPNFAFTKAGTGSLTLSGNNNYSGTTNVSGGNLVFARTNAFYGGAIDASNSAKLTVDSGATVIFAVGGAGEFSLSDFTTINTNATIDSGAKLGVNTANAPSDTFWTLSGPNAFGKFGAGTLVLDAASNGTGDITVSGGTLRIGNLTGGTFTHSSLENNSAVEFNHSNALAYAGSLSGDGSFTKTGAGTLTFTGTDTGTGELLIAQGTFDWAADGSAINRDITVTGTEAVLAYSSSGSRHFGASDGASLTVSDGGTVTHAASSVLNPMTFGDAIGSTATATVSGPGSSLTSGSIFRVGGSGNGTLTIADGGSVSFTNNSPTQSFSTTAEIGRYFPGSGVVSVTGENSTLSVGNRLRIGHEGDGTLTISDGGTVTADSIMMATRAPGVATLNLNTSGTLVVSDASGVALSSGSGSSTFNLAGGTLKSNGTHSLTIESDAILANGTTSTIDTNGQTGTFSGTLSGSGSLLKGGTGTLILSAANSLSGDTTVEAGTLQIANSSGSAFGSGNVTIQSGASLTGVGSFTGALTVAEGATFAPGNSPGLVTIGDGSTLNGVLDIEIGGTLRGTEYDAIDVAGDGTLSLSGILNVDFINDFTPTASDSFQLFENITIVGTFDTMNLPTLEANLGWDTSALYTDGRLDVFAVPEPSAFALIIGFLALCYANRRRT